MISDENRTNSEQLQKKEFLLDLLNQAETLAAKIELSVLNANYYSIFINGLIFYIFFASTGLLLVALYKGKVYITPSNAIEMQHNIYFFSLVGIAVISFGLSLFRLYKSHKRLNQIEIAKNVNKRLLEGIDLVKQYDSREKDRLLYS